MWQYKYMPKCEGGNVDQSIDGVLVCASKLCVEAGVANLIPDPGLLAYFEEANYTNCGTGWTNLRRSSGGTALGVFNVAAAMLFVIGSIDIFM